jgi:hypothetical protein
MTRRRHTLGLTLLAGALLAAAPPVTQKGSWDFRVYLDDAPIGFHRFSLNQEGTERELKSEARFSVKVAFFTAYRYSHDAMEQWRGNCLVGLSSRTDDDGTRAAVEAKPEGSGLAVSTAKGKSMLDGCVMTFAYWNPELLRQERLLNAQTGEYVPVKVADLGEETITVRGAPVTARRYRINGPKNPIDLWYSSTREWLALESTVDGGRRLRYRLE